MADLVWRNPDTAQTAIWFMSGAVAASGIYLPPLSSEWRLVGAGDFDGSLEADLLWFNTNTRAVAVWLMNDGAITGSGYLPATPGAGWDVNAIADFDADGDADLLDVHRGEQRVYVRLMNGTSIVSTTATEKLDAWSVMAVADFNNGGRDVLWQRNYPGRGNNVGQLVIWFMNGTTYSSFSSFPNPVVDSSTPILEPYLPIRYRVSI